MKTYKVLTIRELNFMDQTGKPVSGYQVWLETQTDETGWNGYEILKIWVARGSRLESVVVSLIRGDELTISFTQRGRECFNGKHSIWNRASVRKLKNKK